MAKTSTATRRPHIELLLQRRDDGQLSFVSLLSAYRLEQAKSVVLEAGDAVTSWIQVALVGDFVSGRYGEFSITKKDLSTMEANFSSGKHPVPPTRLCMDYDHLSEDPDAPGDGKAAGWFVKLELREQGTELWALIEWTEPGAEAIRLKEYQFVSPSFHPSFTTPAGEVVGCTLLAAAITNRPFLQGMDPLSLSGVIAGLAMPKAVPPAMRKRLLAEFSFDETRQRICEALERVLGRPNYACDEDYWYVTDVFAEYVIVRRGRHYVRYDYVISDNGDITWAGDPVEVVVQYTPLRLSGTHPGDKTMKTLKLRDAQGHEVEIGEDALEALPLMKELRSKIPTGEVVAKADHEKVVTDVVTLSGQVKTLTDKLADRDAEDDIRVLLEAGKITPAQKDHFKALRLSNQELFTKLTSTLTVVSPVKPAKGSGELPAEDASPLDEVNRLAAAEQQKDAKLTTDQAIAKVLAADRALYARYAASTAIKV